MTLSEHQGGIAIFASFVLALILTVLPLPDWAQSLRPPWAPMVLLYWCIAVPDRVGVGTGWTVGILVDVLTGSLLGQHALGLSVGAYIAVRLHQRIRLFPLWQQALTVLLLLLVERLLALWISGAAGRPPPPLWYWGPPVVGMFLWPWLFIILRDARRRFRVS